MKTTAKKYLGLIVALLLVLGAGSVQAKPGKSRGMGRYRSNSSAVYRRYDRGDRSSYRARTVRRRYVQSSNRRPYRRTIRRDSTRRYRFDR